MIVLKKHVFSPSINRSVFIKLSFLERALVKTENQINNFQVMWKRLCFFVVLWSFASFKHTTALNIAARLTDVL